MEVSLLEVSEGPLATSEVEGCRPWLCPGRRKVTLPSRLMGKAWVFEGKPPCPGFQPSLSPCCLPTPGPGGPEPNSGEPQACVAGEVTSVSQAKQF